MNIKYPEWKSSTITTSKKVFLTLFFIAIAFVHKSFSQEKPMPNQSSSQLLSLYYHIKDALVGSEASAATLNARQFVEAINEINNEAFSDKVRRSLLKDAGVISDNKSIKKQRQAFADLSVNMFALAKSMKLSADPIYYTYCPMEKSYWLSKNKVIKNPYYGNAMLSCGKVSETIE